MRWIIEIESGLDDEQSTLLDEIKAQGHELTLVDYHPIPIPDRIKIDADDEPVVFRGSIGSSLAFQRHYSVIPGAYFNKDNFVYSTYFSKWAENSGIFFNKEFALLPASNLLDPSCSAWIHSAFGRKYVNSITRNIRYKIFVRPNSGLKQFGGQIIQTDRLRGQYSELTQIAPEMLVVVARPRNIVAEYRVVICDRKPITASSYMLDGEINFNDPIPEQVIQTARQIGQFKWQPDVVYVADIAVLEDSDFTPKLIEINSFSSSSLYNCDMRVIVKEVSKAAEKEHKDMLRG